MTNPAREFELSLEVFLELLRPVYGLSNSGDEWHLALEDHV